MLSCRRHHFATRPLRCRTVCKRSFQRSPRRSAAELPPVQSAVPSANGYPDIDAFRQRALVPKKPLLFRNEAGSPTRQLRCLNKWFSQDASTGRALSLYTGGFEQWPFPYELVRSSPGIKDAVAGFRDWLVGSPDARDQVLAGILQSALTESGDRGFFQVYSPLRLLIKALEFNRQQRAESSDMVELYIAQSALEDLPRPLQDDLPTPELVQRAGKGDVYSSSIWLGTEPTYTPLHRDPNPNLFCQLCGHKAVRLLPPSLGDRLYWEVQVQIRQQGNSRIRTHEMMEGKERQVLHDAVWNSDSLPEELQEAELGPGDALFIPDGWWHSVRSTDTNGQLNGSVNWWFR